MKSLRVGVPFARYVEMPGTNASFLKRFARSPAHARANFKISGDAIEFGSAAHCAVLEPDRFVRDYVVWDRVTDTGRSAPRTGKAWEAFKAEHKDAEIITADQHARACALRDIVRADADAMKYLGNGFAEVCVQWTIGERLCKARVDWMTEIDGQPVLIDLKTTQDVRPLEFGKSCVRFGYPLQMAWYAAGVEAATGKTPRVVVIAVESEAPHSVGVFAVGDDVLDLGRQQCEVLLEQLDACERANEWPGPVIGEQPLILPAWAWPDGEDMGGGEELDWGNAA